MGTDEKRTNMEEIGTT